jgi:hypothetical protein
MSYYIINEIKKIKKNIMAITPTIQAITMVKAKKLDEKDAKKN